MGLAGISCCTHDKNMVKAPIIRLAKWQSIPVLLPGKSHGQRSLVSYSLCVAKSQTRLSDFTFHFYLGSHLGGGNNHTSLARLPRLV